MLQKYIEILIRDEVVSRRKSDGTKIDCSLSPKFEIHISSLPGKTMQGWHKRHEVGEVLPVQLGKMKIEEVKDQ